jgi:Icc-related predicted phosphoesterase
LGNHDEELLNYKLPKNLLLLNNTFVNIHNFTIYGLTGILKVFDKHYTFGELLDVEIKNELKDIECDILITHGPPKNILDNKLGMSVGSNSLLEYVKKHKPKYHLFGHAHHSKGTFTDGVTVFSNASIVDKLILKKLTGKPFDFTI